MRRVHAGIQVELVTHSGPIRRDIAYSSSPTAVRASSRFKYS